MRADQYSQRPAPGLRSGPAAVRCIDCGHVAKADDDHERMQHLAATGHRRFEPVPQPTVTERA